MVMRMVCTQCRHVWHKDVLAQRGATRCLFCSGELVAESLGPADDEPPREDDPDEQRGRP